MPDTMTALLADGYGPPRDWRIGDVAIPRPAAGQVRIRVAAAGLNPADIRMRDGTTTALFDIRFPSIPGVEFAGTVDAVGTGVTRFEIGDEVFGLGFEAEVVAVAELVSRPASIGSGALAQYLVVTADSPCLARRPDDLSVTHAAAIPTAGITAAQIVRLGRFKAGQTVAVIGAAGGVGSVVVPVLAEIGVEVVATAIAADAERVRDWGATDIIDYTTMDTIVELRRRHTDGVDAVVNLALPGAAAVALESAVRPSGRLLTAAYDSPDPSEFTRKDITVDFVLGRALRGDLESLAAKAIAGVLPDPVERSHPLRDAAAALTEQHEGHSVGKRVVIVRD